MRKYDQSPPAYSMGKSKRGSINRKDKDMVNVSPYSYSLSFADRRKDPVFSMGKKLGSSLTMSTTITPAPVTYEPMLTQTKL